VKKHPPRRSTNAEEGTLRFVQPHNAGGATTERPRFPVHPIGRLIENWSGPSRDTNFEEEKDHCRDMGGGK